MIDNIQEAEKQFEAHVPYSSAAFLVLKAHLVIEMRLLEFLKARMSPDLYLEVERPREGSFQVRLLLARALAERTQHVAEGCLGADLVYTQPGGRVFNPFIERRTALVEGADRKRMNQTRQIITVRVRRELIEDRSGGTVGFQRHFRAGRS